MTTPFSPLRTLLGWGIAQAPLRMLAAMVAEEEEGEEEDEEDEGEDEEDEGEDEEEEGGGELPLLTRLRGLVSGDRLLNTEQQTRTSTNNRCVVLEQEAR